MLLRRGAQRLGRNPFVPLSAKESLPLSPLGLPSLNRVRQTFP